jgi:hypothetical protein
MFIIRRIFFVDFFVQKEGEGLETLEDLNTPQLESNKFEVRIWNSNTIVFSSFHL